MFSSPIVPAIIPQSQGTIEDFVATLGAVPEVHVDVVDGVFVPFVSWPYTPVGDPSVLHVLLLSYTLEVDLMVSDPLLAARAWLAAGADMLIFHVETISLEALEAFASETAVTIGVCALNSTPYDVLRPYVELADYVQVMGIADIGAQGQPFDERALVRIAELQAEFPHLMISLDGSVNGTTLPSLATLALPRYIVGSAITKAPDPRLAYQELTALASSTGRAFSS